MPRSRRCLAVLAMACTSPSASPSRKVVAAAAKPPALLSHLRRGGGWEGCRQARRRRRRSVVHGRSAARASSRRAAGWMAGAAHAAPNAAARRCKLMPLPNHGCTDAASTQAHFCSTDKKKLHSSLAPERPVAALEKAEHFHQSLRGAGVEHCSGRGEGGGGGKQRHRVGCVQAAAGGMVIGTGAACTGANPRAGCPCTGMQLPPLASP